MDHYEELTRKSGQKQAKDNRELKVLSYCLVLLDYTNTRTGLSGKELIFTWIPASCNQSCSIHRGSIPVDLGLSLEYP